MDLLKENQRFNQSVNQLGNKYLATYDIAHRARICAQYYQNIPLHSEAINWVINNDRPLILNQYKMILVRRNFKYALISKELSYVFDRKVYNSVVQSINCSIVIHHLIYLYGECPNTYHCRVRILVNKIWHQLYSRKEQKDD